MIEITLDGAEALAGQMAQISASVEGAPRELFPSLGELWKGFFRDNVQSGGEGLGWPSLHPATVNIRKKYGHGGKKVLNRGGDLLLSIDVRSVDDESVVVGTDLTGGPNGDIPIARILQDGGQITDDHGTRTVQAFPFIVLSDVQLQDTEDLIRDFYSELLLGGVN